MSASSTEERRARAVLSVVGEPGNVRLTSAVAERGAVQVLHDLRAGSRSPGLGDELAERLRVADSGDVLATATARGLRFVVPGEAEWPACLGDLARVEPLHDRGGVPLGLWLRGARRLDELTAAAVAVVGSRSATTYGVEVAGEIAAGVAEAGHTVVSGAAFGIDQAAHRGALAVRAPTLAVLACGADRVYPTAHRHLLEVIAETGLIVSEAPPGAAPMRIRFLARNRLIAALGQGAVVVEAAVRSGALNTASWASALGRIVMGVPGPVTSAPSQGVHRLLRNRDALLVTRAEEVLEAVAPIGTHLLLEERAPASARDLLPPETQLVLEAVPVSRSAALGSIAYVAGMQEKVVAKALDELVATGFVTRHADGWQLARP